MGIYSGSEVFGPLQEFYIKDTLESIMDDPSITVNEDDDLMYEGLMSVAAINENYNSLMRHIGINELQAIEQTGQEFVYTEGVLSSLWNTLKKFVLKVWDKIKGLFKHFIMIIDSYAKNDRDFCNKYRKQIMAYHNISDFTFKGYKWTIYTSEFGEACKVLDDETDKAHNNNGDAATSTKAEFEATRNDHDSYDEKAANKIMERFEDDFAETLRGTVLSKFEKGKGKAGKYSAEEFRKELGYALRNGEESKEELDDKDIDVHKMFEDLYTSKDTKKAIKELYQPTKKHIDNTIKLIDQADKDHVRNQPQTADEEKAKNAYDSATGHKSGDFANLNDENKKAAIEKERQVRVKRAKYTSKVYAYFSKVVHLCQEIIITMNTVVLNALKERSRQYKACLTKIVHHKSSNESAYTESADYGYQSNPADAFLGNIAFK